MKLKDLISKYESNIPSRKEWDMPKNKHDRGIWISFGYRNTNEEYEFFCEIIKKYFPETQLNIPMLTSVSSWSTTLSNFDNNASYDQLLSLLEILKTYSKLMAFI